MANFANAALYAVIDHDYGMAASGRGIVESGNRLGKMVKEGGTTNKMSNGINESGSKTHILSTNTQVIKQIYIQGQA